MATFGKTTVGASWGTDGNGYKSGCKFTLPEEGRVTKLTGHVRGLAGGPQVRKGVIYADSAGAPGALKGVTAEVSIAASAAAAWVDLSFATPVDLAAGDYWLGFHTGGNNNASDSAYDTLTDGLQYNFNAYADGATDQFGTSTGDPQERSIYATYDPLLLYQPFVPMKARSYA